MPSPEVSPCYPLPWGSLPSSLTSRFPCLLRAHWLTEPNPSAEELFRMVGEIFIYWSKSHVSPHPPAPPLWIPEQLLPKEALPHPV